MEDVHLMETPAPRRRRVCHSLQLALILLTFCLDFGHGIVLGEYDIAFQPLYRVRQSLAIAISRMHNPPARGYLAYQSVIDSLNQNGFAIFNSDKGRHLDFGGWSALLRDTAMLDRALRDAKNTVVDPRLPPQMILGNELGYADYMYVAFRLFGLHIASLYYFYFLVLGVACTLFVLEYGRSPFPMFLLASYLGGLFFLQNYAQSQGNQLASLANSRLFDALSLLPAVHIFLAIWRRLTPKLPALATVSVQALILVFLVGTRTAAVWQVVMILFATIAVTLFDPWTKRLPYLRPKSRFWIGLWPGVLTITFLAMLAVFFRVDADPRYKQETGHHTIWHSVLATLLDDNDSLRLIYLGNNEPENPDQISYDAVINDLNNRHDASSPIAYLLGNGKITIDLERGTAAYDELARSLVLRIIVHHPLAIISTVPQILYMQMRMFSISAAMSWQNLLGAGALGALAGLFWLGAQAERIKRKDAANGTVALLIVLASSLIPVLLSPSNLSVGTLLSFLIAAVVVFFVPINATKLGPKIIAAILRMSKHSTDACYSV
jgi:hypothetical protein